MDLGDCPKIHDYALRADYERAASTRNLNYEFDVSGVFLIDKRERDNIEYQIGIGNVDSICC